mmetsp:Transcript_10080/g.15178  ORF Transcript_10080/g.15178 Transcript_10080/m.15178 type:complete len:98 (-) Transcript_10080:226-519(-)
MVQFLFPDHVKSYRLDPEAISVAKGFKGRTKRVNDTSQSFALSHMCPEDFRARFPDGRMGSDPSRSNEEDGRRLFETAVKDFVELIGDLTFGNHSRK